MRRCSSLQPSLMICHDNSMESVNSVEEEYLLALLEDIENRNQINNNQDQQKQ